MLYCPRCKSENTEVSSELNFTDSIVFDWNKNGVGIKMINYDTKTRALPLPEIRIFLECKDCGYFSKNLNGYDALEGQEEELDIVVKQIYKSVEEPVIKRKMDTEIKFRKYLKRNPTKEQIVNYCKRLKTPEEAQLFLEVVKEYY